MKRPRKLFIHHYNKIFKIKETIIWLRTSLVPFRMKNHPHKRVSPRKNKNHKNPSRKSLRARKVWLRGTRSSEMWLTEEIRKEECQKSLRICWLKILEYHLVTNAKPRIRRTKYVMLHKALKKKTTEKIQFLLIGSVSFSQTWVCSSFYLWNKAISITRSLTSFIEEPLSGRWQNITKGCLNKALTDGETLTKE